MKSRLHEVPEAVWQALFKVLADVHKQLNQSQEYAVDSLPVPVCDNIRIRRCRLYPCPKTDKKTDKKPQAGEGFRGYIASKKRYFGLIFLRPQSSPAGDDDWPAGRGDAGSGQ